MSRDKWHFCALEFFQAKHLKASGRWLSPSKVGREELSDSPVRSLTLKLVLVAKLFVCFANGPREALSPFTAFSVSLGSCLLPDWQEV